MQRAIDGCKVDKRAEGCYVSLPKERAVKPAGLQVKVDWIAHSIERKDWPTSISITANDLYLVFALKPVAGTAYYGQALDTHLNHTFLNNRLQ